MGRGLPCPPNTVISCPSDGLVRHLQTQVKVQPQQTRERWEGESHLLWFFFFLLLSTCTISPGEVMNSRTHRSKTRNKNWRECGCFMVQDFFFHFSSARLSPIHLIPLIGITFYQKRICEMNTNIIQSKCLREPSWRVGPNQKSIMAVPISCHDDHEEWVDNWQMNSKIYWCQKFFKIIWILWCKSRIPYEN